MVQTIIPISEARRRIFEIAEEVQKPGRYYTLTEKGRPKVTVMSSEEFASWSETLEVTLKMPDLADSMATARKDYANAGHREYVTLEQLLEKKGFMVADRNQKKYGVQRPTTTKSSS